MPCCSCCGPQPTSKDAFRLSIASLLATCLAAYLGVRLYVYSGSSLCLVFGLENIVDFLSSAVVLWRFFAPTLTEADELRLAAREQRASTAISMILVLLGVFVMLTSVIDAAKGPEDVYQYAVVWSLALLSLPVFAVLTCLKLRFAKRLQCESLYKDGLCSLIGTSLSGVILFTTLVAERFHESLWWIDPCMAFGAGMIAFYLGGFAVYKSLVVEQTPILTLAWWKQQGTVASTNTENGGISLPEQSAATDKEDLDLQIEDLPSGDSNDSGDKEIV